MSSPDTSSYVDLSVYDETPEEILNRILATGRSLLPEWRPEVGQIELSLAEAFATSTSEVVAAINRVPAATTEILLQLFGITRSDGAAATAELTLTFSTSTYVEAGTEFLYRDTTRSVSYIFSLDEAFNGTTGDVEVTAVAAGSAYNFSADGAALTILSGSVPNFTSAVFKTSPSGGTNPETDAEYFARGVNLLASYTSSLGTASQIQSYVVGNYTGVDRVKVYNRRRYRDRDTTSSQYGYHDGAALVAVGGLVGTPANAATELPVPASTMASMYTDLLDRIPAGMHVDIMTAELADVDVTATVVKQDGTSLSTVKTAVENALEDFFDTSEWAWGTQVRRNDVIALIDSVAGVDYVSALTMDGSTLIGTENIGYYAPSGGTAASVNLDISGATNGTYAAGDAAFYWVDSTTDPDNPTVYTFVNTGEVIVSGGAATNEPYVAIANGVNYNDQNNGGLISVGPTFTGSVGDTGGTATVNGGGAISGGSDDASTFVALDGTGAVSSDLVLRNLGTLVAPGTFTITVT